MQADSLMKLQKLEKLFIARINEFIPLKSMARMALSLKTSWESPQQMEKEDLLQKTVGKGSKRQDIGGITGKF